MSRNICKYILEKESTVGLQMQSNFMSASLEEKLAVIWGECGLLLFKQS
jgi:hypothetical protein